MSGNGEMDQLMRMVNPVVHNRGTSEMSQSESEAVERLGGDGEVNPVVSEKPSQSDSEAVEKLDDGGEFNLVESEKPSQSDSEAVEKLDGDGEFNLVESEKPSQSDSEAVEKLDGDGEFNLESDKLPVPVSSSDDDDSKLSAFKGCGELSTSDETVNALLSSRDADSVLSGPVTAVFQDTGQPTRTDASYMVSCSPSTSVHSSDSVQLTNGTIRLAVSGCNGHNVQHRPASKQVRLKVSVFLLYPLGSVCLKYTLIHLLTC